MSAPLLPGLGAIDIKAIKPVAADIQEVTIEFAELLSMATTNVSPGSLTIAPPPSIAPALTDAAPDDETKEYSPEGWLDSLLLALDVAATRTSRDSPVPMHEKTPARLDSDRATGAVVPAGDSAKTISISVSERANPPSERELANESVFGVAVNNAEKPAVLMANAAINRVTTDLPPVITEEGSTRQSSEHFVSSVGAAPVVRSAVAHTPLVLTHTVGTAAWQNEVATQVAWLVRGADQSATLTLSPVDLGPVDVRITVRESEATVVFTAAHADTRAALEAALPRLRDLFAGQGLALTQGTVLADSSHAFGGSAREQAERAQADLRRVMHLAGEQSAEDTVSSTVQRALLDLYA